MALSRRRFAGELGHEIRARRSFGANPFWQRIEEGLVSKAGVHAFANWFEYSTKILPFLEGVAAINLAAEGRVVGAFAPFARALEKHHRLPRDAVAFWDVHEIAGAAHSDVGDHIVIKHAQSEEARAGVRRAVGTSLGMWRQFFDGIEHEVNAA